MYHPMALTSANRDQQLHSIGRFRHWPEDVLLAIGMGNHLHLGKVDSIPDPSLPAARGRKSSADTPVIKREPVPRETSWFYDFDANLIAQVMGTQNFSGHVQSPLHEGILRLMGQ